MKRSGSLAIPLPDVARPVRRRRMPVLVVVHGDGFVEVYGRGEEVDVLIVQALDVAPANEPAAEQYLEAGLPVRFRHLFWPVNLLACRMPRRVTVNGEIASRLDVALIRTCMQVAR